MLRLAGEAVVGEGVAGEVHPATHGEAAAHGDQEDVRDVVGVVCHTCSSGKLQHILQSFGDQNPSKFWRAGGEVMMMVVTGMMPPDTE